MDLPLFPSTNVVNMDSPFPVHLATMTSLTELSLFGFIPHHMTTELMDAFPTQLQALKIKASYFSNFLKQGFAESLWRMTELRQLKLIYCLGGNAYLEAITPPLLHHASLTKLKICGPSKGPVGLLVTGLTRLQVLDLSDCYLEDMAQWVGDLRHLTHLRSLVLQDYNLDDKTAEMLADVLPHLPCLEVLEIKTTDTSALGLAIQQSLSIRCSNSNCGKKCNRIFYAVKCNRVRHATLESLSCLPNQEKGSIVVKRPHRSSHVRT